MSFGRIFGCLVLVSGVAIANYPASAMKQTEFQTAKVISQDIQSHEVDRGAMTRTPLVRYSNTVVVETASQRMTWVEVSSYATGTRTQDVANAIPLPVHGTIQFYQDGNWFIVLDSSKKKHKFSLVHLESIQ
jgi:hypothetical protein